MTVHRATVTDHMTRSVVAVGPRATFKEIAEALHRYKVSALPVVVADNRVVGVVSEADLLPKEARRDRALHLGEQPQVLEQAVKSSGLQAEELMTAPAVCVHADAPLTEAARIMAVNDPSLKRRACTAGAAGCGAALASCPMPGLGWWVWGG